MAQGKIVLVGQVFKEIYSSVGMCILAVKTSAPFLSGCQLFFLDDDPGDKAITVDDAPSSAHIQSIEIHRRPTNKAEPDQECGIKIVCPGANNLGKSKFVFALEEDVVAAKEPAQTFHERDNAADQPSKKNKSGSFAK